MKRSVIILLAAAAALAALPSQAQQAGSLQFGGAVLNRDIQMPADLAQLSQTHAFGTARAMGMGGAFVSLGADLTSMTLNPAGLGMYRRNEITLTPLVSLSSASTGGTSEWLDNSRSRFSLANLGVALNLYENPKRGLVSLTLGIGVNRVADFNTRYSFSSESRYDSGTGQLMPTIADIFGQQLGQAGIWPAANGSLGYNADPAFWPAILGYNGYMLNVENNGREDLWVPSYIGHNASVGHSMDVVHSGSINEFSLSVGGNIDNVVYFGASLGVQSVRRTSRVTYQEEYLYPGSDGVALDRDGRPLEAQLDYASLQQRQTLSGAGVNFKLGVTVRPVAGLRPPNICASAWRSTRRPTTPSRSSTAAISRPMAATTPRTRVRSRSTARPCSATRVRRAGTSPRRRGCCWALRTPSAASPSSRSTTSVPGTTACA